MKALLIEAAFSRIRDQRGHTGSEGPCTDLWHILNFLNKRPLSYMAAPQGQKFNKSMCATQVHWWIEISILTNALASRLFLPYCLLFLLPAVFFLILHDQRHGYSQATFPQDFKRWAIEFYLLFTSFNLYVLKQYLSSFQIEIWNNAKWVRLAKHQVGI